uniref:Uncharacterized protein n=1 Tax=Tanacetum cinerariifolium TaxID=118510 RepID=A0A699L211_TANCI|nr:hypothetical protein [Tanacetum cinerariifolium]
MHDYEKRLEMIWGRLVNQRRLFEIRAPLVREFILKFLSTCRMSDTEMGLDIADTLCFQLGRARRRMTQRQFIMVLGLHTVEEMAEDGFHAYWLGSKRVISDKGDLKDNGIKISSDREFLGPPPFYVFIRDPVKRLCHMMISCNISGRGQTPEKYLFRHAEERKSGVRLSGGHFIGSLVAYFGLISDQGLKVCRPGTREATGCCDWCLGAAEDAPTVDEGTQADPTPVQAP